MTMIIINCGQEASAGRRSLAQPSPGRAGPGRAGGYSRGGTAGARRPLAGDGGGAEAAGTTRGSPPQRPFCFPDARAIHLPRTRNSGGLRQGSSCHSFNWSGWRDQVLQFLTRVFCGSACRFVGRHTGDKGVLAADARKEGR